MKLIDADAAIDALNEQIEQCNKALCSFDISLKDEYAIKVERASLEAYKEQLENMPSVQPERKTGRWVKSDMQRWYDVWLCSECGEKTDSAVMSKPRYKYCPMCGAKMEEGREDG